MNELKDRQMRLIEATEFLKQVEKDDDNE